MDNQKENVKLIEKVLDMAKSKGAKESEVLFAKSSNFSLKANEGNLEEYKVSSSQVMGIRIGKDQRIGISYCEDMQENSLSLMVDQALENSKYVKEDEYEDIPFQRSKTTLYFFLRSKIKVSVSSVIAACFASHST